MMTRLDHTAPVQISAVPGTVNMLTAKERSETGPFKHLRIVRK